jgi:hypothetical protein
LPFASELLQREFPPPCTHAQSTLIAIGIAMAIFTVFSSLLTCHRNHA